MGSTVLAKPYIVLFHIHGTSISIDSLLFVKKHR